MITPTIINQLQWKAYLIFMCTNLAFIPLVYFCYPETANLTLEEIDYLFTRKNVVKMSITHPRAIHDDEEASGTGITQTDEKLDNAAAAKVEHDEGSD